MWTLAFGHHEDRTPTHGYAETPEAAMAAFAKNWRGQSNCMRCVSPRDMGFPTRTLGCRHIRFVREEYGQPPMTASSRGLDPTKVL
jgi:hypothetical protein